MLFQLESLRFSFLANESIHFADGKSSNILRGAFGILFRRLTCNPQCRSVRQCELRHTCPYARIFEPSSLQAGPSGLADWPRPFVFHAAHLDSQTFSAGEHFHFDLNLFDTAFTTTSSLVLTFAQLAREGLGSERRKVELTSVARLDEHGEAGDIIYKNGRLAVDPTGSPLTLNLDPNPEPVSCLTVHFLTRTELKSGDQLVRQPDFSVLATRARDRISTLRQCYGSGPLTINFRDFGERAAEVRMTRCEIEHIHRRRHSSRTGQVHSIGGFIGEARYEGALSPFLPYLRAAKWTGVGRQTSWGKGQISILNAH